MKTIKNLLLAFMCLVSASAMAQKYVGGDISLLPSYEENGSKYLDQDGTPIDDVILFSKDNGLNAMRVRLFVDPSKAPAEAKRQGVCQDLDYVKALGKRIKDAGLKLMLDFHYSDTWADPTNQWTPDAWKSLDDDALYQQIYDYTKDVLQELKAAGAEPDFIQTGNEISYGLCWGPINTKTPVKSWENWDRFTTLLKQAGKACREECPEAKIIIHTELVRNTGVLTDFYNHMRDASVDYDIIGTSFYSYYHGNLEQLEAALKLMEGYGKDIMIVEVGYFYAWQPEISGSGADLSDLYPVSGEGQAAYTQALIDVLNRHERVTGLFWWMMEANEYGHTGAQQTTNDWYNASLWDDRTGHVNPAFFLLQDFLEGQADGIRQPEQAWPASQDDAWYTLSGLRVSHPVPQGLYIHHGKKCLYK